MAAGHADEAEELEDASQRAGEAAVRHDEQAADLERKAEDL
jgi:hypothetical protein